MDFIHNGSGETSDYDSIELGSGIDPATLRVARAGDALVIDVGTGGDRLVVLGHFRSDDAWYGGSIDALRFSDGTIWEAADIAERLGPLLEPIALNFANNLYSDYSDAAGYIIGVQSASGDYYGAQFASTVFDLGAGEVRELGGESGDTYVYGYGYGRHTVLDAGGVDRIMMNEGVSAESVALIRIADRLIVQLSEQDRLTIEGFFGEAGQVIESLVFADGTRWDSAYLLQNARLLDVELLGGDRDDVLLGGAGYDRLYGHGGNDVLDAGAGDDLLDGGSGADVLRGGEGSDTYVVDDVGDMIVDDSYASDYWKKDVNTVRSTIDYVLGGNLHTLVLEGDDDLNGVGNEESNTLVGNSGANILRAVAADGFSGQAEWFDGGAGNDTLIGAWGNDTLIGGAGDDWMEGGSGDDLYFVESAGDIVIEGEGGGVPSLARQSTSIDVLPALAQSASAQITGLETGPFGTLVQGEHPERDGDTVVASIDFTLGTDLESLILAGNALAGTGNELSNSITGNSHDNELVGLGGYDWIFGGAGDDALYGGDDADQLDGGEGDDLLVGGDGDDSYSYSSGQGNDVIVNVDAYGEDSIHLLGATLEQVGFVRSGDDLVATLANQEGSVTFTAWYQDAANRVDRWFDQNGSELTADQVDALAESSNQVAPEANLLIEAMARPEAQGEAVGPFWSGRDEQSHLLFAVN